MLASTIFLVLLLVFIGSGMMGRLDKGTAGRYVAIWGLAFLVLFLGYRVFDRFTAAPREVNGRFVLNVPFSNFTGGYSTLVRLNGNTETEALFDTGASIVAIPYELAQEIGLSPETLSFDAQVSTANGTTSTARAQLSEICFGDQCFTDIPVSVSQQGALNDVLIGTPLLSKFQEVRIIDNTLHITF